MSQQSLLLREIDEALALLEFGNYANLVVILHALLTQQLLLGDFFLIGFVFALHDDEEIGPSPFCEFVELLHGEILG